MLDPALPKESEFTGLESLSVQRGKGGTYVQFQGTAPVLHPLEPDDLNSAQHSFLIVHALRGSGL